MDNKIRMITQLSNRRRSTVVFFTLSVIFVLSIYFVIAYFLSMRTFQSSADLIKDLEIIFYKGSCFDTSLNFLRENVIRNNSMMIKLR